MKNIPILGKSSVAGKKQISYARQMTYIIALLLCMLSATPNGYAQRGVADSIPDFTAYSRSLNIADLSYSGAPETFTAGRIMTLNPTAAIYHGTILPWLQKPCITVGPPIIWQPVSPVKYNNTVFTLNAHINPSYLQKFPASQLLFEQSYSLAIYNPGANVRTDSPIITYKNLDIPIYGNTPNVSVNLDLTSVIQGMGGKLLGDTTKPAFIVLTPYTQANVKGISIDSILLSLNTTHSVVLTPYTTACFNAQSVNTSDNPVTFNWTDCCPVSDYQIQVLRLYNIDSNNYNNPTTIKTVVDWSQALSIETNTGDQFIKLTLAEGTGYYVWRVRRIFDNQPNGIGDNQNWGPWTGTGAFGDGDTVTVSAAASPYLFYYNQYDDNLNWIYQRQFVEGEINHSSQTRMGEKMTYADFLLNPIQDQIKAQTADTILASQTVPDFLGRPSLKTLPAPIGMHGFTYKKNFVLNSSNQLYTASDYDQQSNYLAPSSVGSNSMLNQYYSDANADISIPSAQGIPYTRTRYYNDGLNREAEIGSPGSVHAINSVNSVKKYYCKSTATELIRIFGDEAPDAASVLKTYTVDPNGVFNISFTDQNDKVLATCLTTPHSTLMDALPSNTFVTRDTVEDRMPASPGIRFISKASYTFAVPTKLNYLYNIIPHTYSDACVGVCATCDYKVILNAQNREDTATADIYTDTLVVKPNIDSNGSNCVASLQSLPNNAYFGGNTLAPGTYDVTLSLVLDNHDPIKNEAYVDSVVNVMHRRLDHELNTSSGTVIGGASGVTITQMQTYLANADITGLLNYTHADTSQPFFKFVINCDTIQLPTAHCASNCGQTNFAEYMINYLHQYDSSFYSGVTNITQLTDSANYLFWEPSNASFDAMMNNMINVDHYNCDSVWNAWEMTVESYAVAQESMYQAQIASGPSITPFSSSMLLVDFWGDYMKKVGYKSLSMVSMATYVSTELPYAYKYFPYNWGKSPLAESNFSYLYDGTNTPGNPPNWYSAANGMAALATANFPSDPGTYPFHIYNLYLAIKQTNGSNPGAGSAFAGIGNATGAINMGTLPSPGQTASPQTFAQMQEECFHECELRLPSIVNTVAQACINAGMSVSGYNYPSWQAAPTSNVTLDQVYCAAYSILASEEAKCNITPNASGAVDTASAYAYQQALVDGIDVQINPTGGPCDAVDGYQPVNETVGSSGGFVSQPALLSWLNNENANVMDSLLQGGAPNATWMPLFAASGIGLGSAYTPCANDASVTSDVTDQKEWFTYGLPTNKYINLTGVSVTSVATDVTFPGIAYPMTYPVNAYIVFNNPPATYTYDSVMYTVTLPAGASFQSTMGYVTGNITSGYTTHFKLVPSHLVGDTIAFTYYVNTPPTAGTMVISDQLTVYNAVNLGSHLGNLTGSSSRSVSLNNCLTLYYNRITSDGRLISVAVCKNGPCAGGTLNCINACMRFTTPGTPPDSVTADTTLPVTCGQLICQNFNTNLYSQIQQIHDRHEAALRAQYNNYCLNKDSINDLFYNYYQLTQYNYTLYYYDRAGNLIRTVSPGGVEDTGTSRFYTPEHNFVTQYEYNTLGQKVKETTPDGGYTNYWYDRKGRLRFSQTFAQYMTFSSEYSYINYDDLSRVIETGQVQMSGGLSRYIDSLCNTNYPLAGGGTLTFRTHTYYSTAFPTSGTAVPNVSTLAAQSFILNRVSYTLTDRDGNFGTTTDQVYDIYSYDPHGNVSMLYEWVSGMPDVKIVSYAYDLISNKPTSVTYQSGINNASETYTQQYAYDADKRLTKVQSSTNNGTTWEQDALYTYYMHGPLRREVLGNNLQGLDYTYTIEGWLKAINHSVLSVANDPGHDQPPSGVGTDVFGMVLNYYTGDFTRTGSVFNTSSSLHMPSGNLYNGNIEGWSSTTKMFAAGDPYTSAIGNQYHYDELNRITQSNPVNFTGSAWSSNVNYTEAFAYDGNGNLKSLMRNFINVPGGVSSPTVLDNLTYTYTTGTNQLQSVSNTAPAAGLANGGVKSTSYTYDYNGNMATDAANNIHVFWTPDNKIDYMTIGGRRVRYYYDANGNRMAELTDSSSIMLNSEYYMYDASQNKLAVYKGAGAGAPTISEREIYGTERLASLLYTTSTVLHASPVFGVVLGHIVSPTLSFPFNVVFNNSTLPVYYSGGTFLGTFPVINIYSTQTISSKQYEIHDHLGNVRMTISDVKDPSGQAIPLSASNYYAYGSPMPMKTVTPTSRYGFNSQDKDDYIYGPGFANTARYWEYDTRLGRRWNMDPKLKTSESSYEVLGDNPILNIDPFGDDWYKDNNGTMKYDPKVQDKSDLKNGQIYIGQTYLEKTKKGNINYRQDGSIMFSNETDAYNRMWNYAKEPGGGTKTHETFGVIMRNGVLVLPDYKNNSTTSETGEYGYKFANSRIYDPITKNNLKVLGTIHTHQLKLDNGPSASPSREDIDKFINVTPNKPFMTMGWDGNVHAAVGNQSGFGMIQLPKGYSKNIDLLQGASLIQLLKANQPADVNQSKK